MQKDYAKSSFKPKRTRSLWWPKLFLAITVLLILGGGYIAYIHQNPSPKQIAIKTDNNAVRFDFYTELPGAQVTVAPVAIAKTTAPAYVLQLGVYKNQASAAEMRLSLLLAGIDADIVQEAGAYSIQKGHYANQNLAKVVQLQLQRKGVDSRVKKVS